jgi:K+-transporting ATPase ATPase C chain
MKKEMLTAVKFILLLTVLTGICYPLAMTGLAQLAFPEKANGSLIVRDGIVIGSDLLGQKFDSVRYFSSRPSASDYSTMPSGASNLGPTSNVLRKQVEDRRSQFMQINGMADSLAVPYDMLFASGSGLDPHISQASALLQVNRIAVARHFDEAHTTKLKKMILDRTEPPQFLLFGESRINVLRLNIELDKMDDIKSESN